MKRTVPLGQLLRMAFLLAFCAVVSLAQQNPATPKPGQGSQAKSEIAARELQDSGVARFIILDSATGYVVDGASVSWGQIDASAPEPLPNSRKSTSGILSLRLAPGEYAFEITAPGYRLMRTHSAVTAGAKFANRIHLDPVAPPPELQEDVVSSQLKEGFDLVHGYIVDSNTHRPIAGVSVRLKESGAITTTDARGYFSLYAPAAASPNPVRPEEAPSMDTLVASKRGYKTYVLDGMLYVSGSDSVVRIEMIPGIGTLHRRIEHGALEPAPQQTTSPKPRSISSNIRSWVSLGPGEVRLSASEPVGDSAVLASISLPTSIRVGTNCFAGNGKYGCTTVSAYTLETYVQEGLENEWPSYWATDSLKAGSVAYRSYGAYYAIHPLCPIAGSSNCPVAYDICGNTYCQAFNEVTAKPTVNAAKATAGIVVSRDGVSAFEALHAGNGNGFMCGDGTTGDPGKGWPCMADPASEGSQSSGHPWGMSQWGSQYWASGMSYLGVAFTPAPWQCIVDHYYNDNGNSTGAGTGQRTAFIEGVGGDGGVAYAVDKSTQSQVIWDIYTAKGDGSASTKIVSNRAVNRYPTWSPDEKRLIFSYAPACCVGEPLYVVNADGSGLQQLTPSALGVGNQGSNWGTNQKIAFSHGDSAQTPASQIWTMNEDGSNQTRLVSSTADGDPFWSPDASRIVFICDFSYEEYSHICVMNADGSGRTRLTLPTAPANLDSTDVSPSWSPDGQKIAFSSNRGGEFDIWVMNKDGSGLTQLTFNMGAHYPRWSRDGRSIVFIGGDFRLYIMNADGSGLRPLGSQTSVAWWGGLDTQRCRRFDRLNQ